MVLVRLLLLCSTYAICAERPVAASLLWRRYLRALANRDQTKQHLEELEESIPEQHLDDWRDEEKQWQERVLHLSEDIDFGSPYELRKDNGTIIHPWQ